MKTCAKDNATIISQCQASIRTTGRLKKQEANALSSAQRVLNSAQGRLNSLYGIKHSYGYLCNNLGIGCPDAFYQVSDQVEVQLGNVATAKANIVSLQAAQSVELNAQLAAQSLACDANLSSDACKADPTSNACKTNTINCTTSVNDPNSQYYVDPSQFALTVSKPESISCTAAVGDVNSQYYVQKSDYYGDADSQCSLATQAASDYAQLKTKCGL